MDLAHFPIDEQVCSLVFESYSYNTATVSVGWMNTAVTVAGEVTLPDFDLVSLGFIIIYQFYSRLISKHINI